MGRRVRCPYTRGFPHTLRPRSTAQSLRPDGDTFPAARDLKAGRLKRSSPLEHWALPPSVLLRAHVYGARGGLELPRDHRRSYLTCGKGVTDRVTSQI